MIEYLKCNSNETTISTIYKKVNELIDASGKLEQCCNSFRADQEIKTLRVGDFLF